MPTRRFSRGGAVTAQLGLLKQVNVRRGLEGFGGIGQGFRENRYGHQSLLTEHDGDEEGAEEADGRRPCGRTHHFSEITVDIAAMTPQFKIADIHQWYRGVFSRAAATAGLRTRVTHKEEVSLQEQWSRRSIQPENWQCTACSALGA